MLGAGYRRSFEPVSHRIPKTGAIMEGVVA